MQLEEKIKISSPHAPFHKTLVSGTYMVTAATYEKKQYFDNEEKIKFLHNQLIELSDRYHWHLQAWAVLSNHYHFIAQSKGDPQTLRSMISHLHVTSARFINGLDNTPHRKVWYQYWDSHITYPYSYLARLNYVNQNPVKHGLVKVASDYPWCSAAWFQTNASTSFYKTVSRFKTDSVNIIDDF